jgi:hypothetical protein
MKDIEPKFKIRQMVFYMKENKVPSSCSFSESDLYASKEKLLNTL